MRQAMHDTWLLFARSLKHTFRSPEILVGITVSPIMFVLLFRYVFGGAIVIPGLDYVDFLMPGIFVQTIAFGALTTAISLAYDFEKGIVERFFTLPMSRSAIITGRTFADVLRTVFTIIVMVIVGVLVGYTPSGSAGDWLLAGAIMLLFCFAISWLGAIMALLVPNVEALQQISFIVILPLTFLSSAFVQPATMPDGLKQFAEHQPVSIVVDAVRALTNGIDPGNSVKLAIIWCVGILVVSMPIASLMFRRLGSR
jgi:ABC-2 type transport system permease protein/oleandomycin transport system permease protein